MRQPSNFQRIPHDSQIQDLKDSFYTLTYTHYHYRYEANEALSLCALWFGQYSDSFILASRAMSKSGLELRREIYIKHLYGRALLSVNALPRAEEQLHQALASARSINLVEVELPTLIALGELRRRQGDLKAARDMLDSVWESAERGSFRLFQADAYNILTKIERNAKNHDAAVEAATKAYHLAWCDGPPYSYHWELQKANEHLFELDAPTPSLPSFDSSKYQQWISLRLHKS